MNAVRVFTGDCLHVLADAPSLGADVAYLDPPFNTGRTQSARGGAYDDRFSSIGAYLAFLRPRVAATIDALTPRGVILLHCDWRTCHHLRLMLDDLLGPERFVNHLIWRYGLGGSSPRRFARKHDDILFYARSDSYHFAPPRVPATSARMRGLTKKATDVLDVPSINNMAAERTGYPTQKPVALLTLLLGAVCPSGGTALDPFCGSGTTLVAARQLGLGAVGIDVSPEATALAQRRCDACVSDNPGVGGAMGTTQGSEPEGATDSDRRESSVPAHG